MIKSGKPQQLQMFMTPREITSQYQPLDGDRQDGMWPDRSVSTDNKYGEHTARSHNTQGDSNFPRNVWKDGAGRRLNTEEHKGRPYQYSPGSETDQQVWDRKLDESQASPEEYAEMRGDSGMSYSKDYMNDSGSLRNNASYPKTSDFTGTGKTDNLYEERYEYKGIKQMDYEYDKNNDDSLYDSVRSSGVQFPVHLGTQFGSSNKPEVVGGHHRIAAALDAAPDQPIPVLHHTSIHDARSDSNKDAGFGYR